MGMHFTTIQNFKFNIQRAKYITVETLSADRMSSNLKANQLDKYSD